MSGLTERFDTIRGRMAEAAVRSGRSLDKVRLVAVSKLHPAEAVAELTAHWAAQGGNPVFGESYMQEGREKIPLVSELLARQGCHDGALLPEWHFIGHVQSRKARDIAGQYRLIHSLDSLKLARAMQKAWRERVETAPVRLDEAANRPQEILVQVNVGKEEQKSGVAPEELESLLNSLADMPELQVRGLMCIPPLASIGGDSRRFFVMLRELRDKVQLLCGLALTELSMGMSDDFEAAIEEGATLVRIGSDIFGPRVSIK